jgi:hypothetical protein
MEKQRVVMTGVITRLPEPYLTPERDLGCRLSVRAQCLSVIGLKRCIHGGNYSVEVTTPVHRLLLKYAIPDDRVLVCGYLSGSGITGAAVFRKPS